MKNLFKFRTDYVAVQQKSGAYYRENVKNIDEVLEKHLSHEETIAVYLIEPADNTVQHVIIDIDEINFDLVKKVLVTCESLGISSESMLIEFSGKKGYHIWFKFETSVPASKARKFGEFLRSKSGIPLNTEVFPKQDKVDQGSYGNAIKLPLGLHQVSEKPSHFCDVEGKEIDSDQVLLSWDTLKENQIDDFIDLLNSEKKIQKQKFSSDSKKELNFSDFDFSVLPECYQTILKVGVSDGSRNKVAFDLALMLKKNNFDKAKVKNILLTWNQKNNPPTLDNEIQKTVQSVFSKQYQIASIDKPVFKKYCTGLCPYCEGLQTLSYQDLVASDFEHQSILIGGGLLSHGGKMILAAEPKIGKSFLALQMAFSLALGKDFLGFNVPKKRKVLYLQNEIADKELKKRFQKMVDVMGMPDPDNLFSKTQKAFDVMNSNHLFKLDEELDKNNYDVLIVDPLATFHHKNENDAQDMNLVLGKFRELSLKYNIGVVLVHHFNKSYQEQYSYGANRMRGSNVLHAWPETVLTIGRKRNNLFIELSLRNAESPDKILVKKEGVIFERQGTLLDNTENKLTSKKIYNFLESQGKDRRYQANEIVKLIRKSDLEKLTGSSERNIKDILNKGKGVLFSCDSSKKPFFWTLIPQM